MPDQKPRGFQLWEPSAQRAVASQGGRASHEAGTAHEFTSDEARAAAKLRRTVYSREHMAAIGGRGGRTTAAKKQAAAAALPRPVLVRCPCGFRSRRRETEETHRPRFGTCPRCSRAIDKSSAEMAAQRRKR